MGDSEISAPLSPLTVMRAGVRARYPRFLDPAAIMGFNSDLHRAELRDARRAAEPLPEPRFFYEAPSAPHKKQKPKTQTTWSTVPQGRRRKVSREMFSSWLYLQLGRVRFSFTKKHAANESTHAPKAEKRKREKKGRRRGQTKAQTPPSRKTQKARQKTADATKQKPKKENTARERATRPNKSTHATEQGKKKARQENGRRGHTRNRGGKQKERTTNTERNKHTTCSGTNAPKTSPPPPSKNTP